MTRQLALGNSFPAIELINPTLDLRRNCFAIFRKPAVLLFLSFQQVKQHFLDGVRTCHLKLLPDPSFDFRVTDFDVHRSRLRKPSATFLSS